MKPTNRTPQKRQKRRTSNKRKAPKLPRRVQLSRGRAWRKPNTVAVARPTRWGNPFRSEPQGGAWAVKRFRQWVRMKAQTALRERAKQELRGKNLACWCKPGEPCHADVWLTIVNPKAKGRK